ncbi:hypothetical protein B0H13DRAFT_2663023 [Mycena leptocephala]|nr:hypothetical protein B0H13DRAFT_2663023 [Mycena leptocephala]
MDARGAPHLSTLPPRLPMARCSAAQQSIGIIYLLFGKKPGAMLLGSKRGGTFEISNAVRGACEWEWRPVAHGAHVSDLVTGPLQPAFQVIYLSAIVDILTSHFEFPDARFFSGDQWNHASGSAGALSGKSLFLSCEQHHGIHGHSSQTVPTSRFDQTGTSPSNYNSSFELADSDRDDVVELFLDFDHLQIRETHASAINRGGLLPLRRPLSSHNTTCAPMSVVEKGKGREPTS